MSSSGKQAGGKGASMQGKAPPDKAKASESTRWSGAGTSFSLRTALIIIVGLNALRLLSGLTFDLVPQEAYYFLYSQHPALSYFDHPPLMAWSLFLSTALLGAHPFVLRLTAFLLTSATQFFFFVLARRFLPKSKAIHAALLFCTTAMVSVLSLISLPDVPLLLFWTLSLICLERAIFQGEKKFWLLAGLCMGLAFDGKYTAAMLQVGLAIFLVLSPNHRKWLKTPWPYLAVVLAHAAMLPVYVWNAENGFASFLFQSADRASTWKGLHIIYFLKLLGSQTALLLPGLFLGLWWTLRRIAVTAFRRRPLRMIQDRPLFLLSFFAPLFLGFTALSFITLVKPNWIMPAYISGTILAAMLLNRRLVRLNLIFAAVLHAVIAAELIAYPVPILSNDTWYGWKELAGRASELLRERPQHFVFSDDDYKTSAELGFYLGRKTYSANILGKRGLQYDYLGDDLTALLGKNALYFEAMPRDMTQKDVSHLAPPRKLVRHFERVEGLPTIVIENPLMDSLWEKFLGGKKAARKFRVFDCQGYLGPQGKPDVGWQGTSASGETKVERIFLPNGSAVDVVLPDTAVDAGQGTPQ